MTTEAIRDARDSNGAAPNQQPEVALADPGGAHSKGYSAEAGPLPAVPEQDPVPLAAAPAEGAAAIHVPERDNHVEPTGRKEPGDYTTNDHLMGADR